MPAVTLDWLQIQAKQLVKKYWDIVEIPTIQLTSKQDAFTIERKLDWDNYVGFYCSNIKTVVLNNEINSRRTLREIKRTLLHELCHWRLHTMGESWRDSDERFAREMIRVGLGRRHNSDEQSQLAARLARKRKKDESFEIVERTGGEIISIRLKHTRKNVEDFKKDLANTLLRVHSEKEIDETIYPADIAEKMKEWYGYRVEPNAVFGIELSAGDGYGWGDIGGEDNIARVIEELDIDEDLINKKFRSIAAANE